MNNIPGGVTQPKIACFVNRHPGTVAEKLVSPFMKYDAWEGDKGNQPSKHSRGYYSFPLYGGGWFAGDVIDYAVDAGYFVDDTAGDTSQ